MATETVLDPFPTSPTITMPRTAVLGPLTTTFTPPSSCSDLYRALYGRSALASLNTNFIAFQAVTCIGITAGDPYGSMVDDWPCWPTVTSMPSSGHNDDGWGLYSPGLICPAGYTTACSSLATTTEAFQFQFSLLANESAVGCCPRYVHSSALR